MSIPYEIEIKLAVRDAAEFARLRAALDAAAQAAFQAVVAMKAIYFDTADRLLSKRRLAYRIRRENDMLLATIKGGGSADGGLHKRLEYSVSVTSEEPDLHVFAAAADCRELLGELTASHVELGELVRTEFERVVYLWQDGAAQIEIALDKGWIYGGTQRVPILEAELELKAGDELALQQLSSRLRGKFALSPSNESKFARGMELRQM